MFDGVGKLVMPFVLILHISKNTWNKKWIVANVKIPEKKFSSSIGATVVANTTIVTYGPSAEKNYNAKGSLARFENKI
jgi:hypothetical protein